MVTPGYWALAVAIAAAVVLGLAKQWYDGHFRTTRPRTPDGARLTRGDIGGDLGSRATLLQFSSAFCAPCRATKRVLADVTDAVPGVVHVEVDAESNLALVRRLNVLKTPTTLVLDAQGREVRRATGQPTKQAVLHALAQAVPS